MAKLILILGGARSGKSTFAEQQAAMLSPSGDVAYIATAQIFDEEMRVRVAAHRTQRPQRWQTVEAPTGIASALEAAQVRHEVILLDCLTLLVSNLLLGPGREAGEMARPAVIETRVEEELSALIGWYRQHDTHLIIVSNEVGMGLVPEYPAGRVYRDILGRANQRLARLADHVYLLIAGLPVDWKALSQALPSPDM